MIYKFLTLASLVASTFASFVPVTRYGPQHETIKDEYIVRFAPDASREFAAFQAKRSLRNVNFNHFGSFMGFSATLTEQELAMVQQTPGVLTIEPNGRVYALGVQENPVYGLDRVDQRELPYDQRYFWDDASDGTGVRIYVLDTGILTTHIDFQGRAHFEADCTGVRCETGIDTADQQGHGTHCAGTVGATTYGVAKGATIHNVRCLNAGGSGSFEGIINSIEFVANQVTDSVKIISMSLGGGRSEILNAAVDAAFDVGVLSVIAAGNSNNDACTLSPASADRAFTVAASDIADTKASFSSFGPCVDIWAPGVNVESLSNNPNNNSTSTLSGTSMACPHVAGAAALVASRGITQPADIAATLVAEATPDVIRNNPAGTPNLLLFTNPTRMHAF